MKHIDLANMEVLPSRRQRDKMDRERLADAAHRKACAKHKGRNHWRNWERRMMALAAAAERRIKAARSDAARKRYGEQVRAYWADLRAKHPGA